MPLDKKVILIALSKMRQESPPRKFGQSVELAINFRGIDFKKAENRIDALVTMPHSTGKGSARVGLFAKDKAFADRAKGLVAGVIYDEDIPKLDKKASAKLAEEYDAFLAEGPTMLTVGKHLGQILAPKGKMPRPVMADLAAVEQALKNIKSGVRVTNKKGKFMPVVHLMIGTEKMNDDELADNMLAVYNAVLNAIANQEPNIKTVFVKLTMGPAVQVGFSGSVKA